MRKNVNVQSLWMLWYGRLKSSPLLFLQGEKLIHCESTWHKQSTFHDYWNYSKFSESPKTNIVPWGVLTLEWNTLSCEEKHLLICVRGKLWSNNNNTDIDSILVKLKLFLSNIMLSLFLRLRWDGHAVKPTLLNEQVTHNINHKMNKKCIKVKKFNIRYILIFDQRWPTECPLYWRMRLPL